MNESVRLIFLAIFVVLVPATCFGQTAAQEQPRSEVQEEATAVEQSSAEEKDLQGEDLQGEDVQGEDVQGEDVQGEDVQGEDVQESGDAEGVARVETSHVIDNVKLVDVENGTVTAACRVVFRGKRIEQVGLASEVEIPESAVVVDATGKFLIPGLFDAHVHLTTSMPSYTKLLVANGVTGCRDTGAVTGFIMSAKRNSIEPDEIMPVVFATGAIVDGDPPVWPFSESCNNAEEARDAVRKLKAAGVDQIKVYALLPEDAYRAAVEEAHKLELKATGHVAKSVDLHVALEVGQDCIEHLDGFERLLLELNGFEEGMPEFDDLQHPMEAWKYFDDTDKDKLDAHLKQHVDRGTFHCPTLVVMDGIGRATDENRPGEEDERMIYVHPFTKSFWTRGGYGAFSPVARAAVPSMQKMVKRMHDQGVQMVIGTDLANPYVFAGSSVHDEMVLFEEAGIPAATVLKMATLNPARLVNAEDQIGTIAPGKLASMVLLDANPLESIGNVRRISAVWNKGVYHDRESLDEMIKSLEIKR